MRCLLLIRINIILLIVLLRRMARRRLFLSRVRVLLFLVCRYRVRRLIVTLMVPWLIVVRSMTCDLLMTLFRLRNRISRLRIRITRLLNVVRCRLRRVRYGRRMTARRFLRRLEFLSSSRPLIILVCRRIFILVMRSLSRLMRPWSGDYPRSFLSRGVKHYSQCATLLQTCP